MRPYLLTTFRKFSLQAVFAGSCLLIAVLDTWLGSQICPWFLYLLPVAAGGWLLGLPTAMFLSTLSVALIGFVGLWAGHPFARHGYFMVSLVNRSISLFLVGYLATQVGRLQDLKSILRSYEEQP